MAHMVETMAYAGQLPWHGLGKEVHNDLTPDQMLVEAGLDWEVDKIPAFANVNGKQVSVGHSALVRSSDHKILDVISDDWNPMQNRDAFEFFNEFVMAGDMEMHTAGSLRGGQLVWGLAKIKESFELFGGDKVDGYLLFTNPHLYGKSIDVRFTPIRVVCNNTLTLAVNSKVENMVKVSHRREFDASQVKETLGVAKEKLAKYKGMAAFLGTKRYTGDNVVDYFKTVFPVLTAKEDSKKLISKNASLALDIINTQPGAEYAEGSWWQAFNTVTYMTDHLIGRSADNRLTSAWYGSNKNLKTKALETAVEFAEVS